MTVLFLFIVGAVVGSFLGALTWRMPKEISITDGRSRCPHCNQVIRWYDNIPVVSYIALGGHCRDCKKPIPRRDFLIESGVALLFPLAYFLMPGISTNIVWLATLPETVRLFVILTILGLSVAIFIVDFEHRYIPDSFVFLMVVLVGVVLILISDLKIYTYLASGLGAGVFLLLIHLVTLGRGMGLGDTKLALAIGLVLGFPFSVLWMFSSFILGSIVGIMLVVMRAAKFKQEIAFGPFLIVGFFIIALFGNNILSLFQSYF